MPESSTHHRCSQHRGRPALSQQCGRFLGLLLMHILLPFAGVPVRSQQIGHLFAGGSASQVYGSSLIPPGVSIGPSWNRFLSFTRILPLPATPITAKSAILFAAYLGSERLSVSTIASYMATLRHFCVVSDPNCPLPSLHSPYLKVLLRGYKRIQAQPTSARIRLPITDSLMRRIKAQLSLPPTSFLKMLIWAHAQWVSLGFFRLASSAFLIVSNSIQTDTCCWRTLCLIHLLLGGGSW